MLKRSSAILSVIIGMVVLFLVGCSKDNHDTIIHVGDESIKSPLDTIYPKNYRDLWRYVAPTCSNTVYEGLFPPDITGLYEMAGDYRGSDEKIFLTDGYIDFITPDNLIYYGRKYLYLLIEEQVNGIAKLKFKTNYRNPINPPYNYDTWNEIDTAYVWGNGATGDFTLCFDCWIAQGNKNYKNGFIVNGKKRVAQDGSESIANMEFWTVIKKRSPNNDQPGIMKLGGQNMYFSSLVLKKEQETE